MSNIKVELADLELHQRFMSLEQVSDLHSTSAAVQKMVQMTVETGSFIKDKIGMIPLSFNFVSKIFGTNALSKVKAFVKEKKYMDCREMTVVVPESFEGNLLEYTERLHELYKEYNLNFIQSVIKPCDLYISKLINTPTLLSSVDFTHDFKDINLKDIENARKLLAKYDNGSYAIEAKLGDVFGNLNQVEQTFKAVNLFGSDVERTNLREVKKQVDVLSDKINLLADTIKENRLHVNVSGKILTELSQLAMDIAVATDFFAVLYTLYTGLNDAMAKNKEIIDGVK